MEKIVSYSMRISPSGSNKKEYNEHEELNNLLQEGWTVSDKVVVTSEQSASSIIIFHLYKSDI